MLLEKNVVGKKTDWANYITLSDEHETPLLRRLPKGDKAVNVVKHYQADKYSDPSGRAWPEGKDWDNFKSAAANRRELQARVEYVVETAAVGKLAQDVTDTAGVSDELAREVTHKMTEVARRLECCAASDQASHADDGVIGHEFRGAFKWIQTGAQSDADMDVDASIRPASDQIYAGTKANFVETSLKGMLQSMWKATGSKETRSLIGGAEVIEAIEFFQFLLPTSGSTQSTARVTERSESDMSLGTSVRTYKTTWGNLELELSRWNQFSGFGGNTANSTTLGDWWALVLTPRMWEWNWNQKPTVHKPEYKGGSYKAAIETILMLLCKNPIGEGAIKPSDA